MELIELIVTCIIIHYLSWCWQTLISYTTKQILHNEELTELGINLNLIGIGLSSKKKGKILLYVDNELSEKANLYANL